MAKVAKRKQTSKGLRLEVVNPNAAGIDISPKEMQVCVPSDRDGECNRTFGVYTEDLHYIAEWLKACCIDTVAMESTGIYWLPVFRILNPNRSLEKASCHFLMTAIRKTALYMLDS